MPAQLVEVFPVGNTDDGWRNELFEFLNNRIDQILEQTHMEKIEDITGAVEAVKSVIHGKVD